MNHPSWGSCVLPASVLGAVCPGQGAACVFVSNSAANEAQQEQFCRLAHRRFTGRALGPPPADEEELRRLWAELRKVAHSLQETLEQQGDWEERRQDHPDAELLFADDFRSSKE